MFVDLGYRPHKFQQLIHERAKRFTVVVAHRRFGKCLDVDTPIPTPSGYVEMGALKAGDLVFGPDGVPTRVVAAHAVQVGLQCYRVRFSDGAEIVCDSEHLWNTQTRLDRAARNTAGM